MTVCPRRLCVCRNESQSAEVNAQSELFFKTFLNVLEGLKLPLGAVEIIAYLND